MKRVFAQDLFKVDELAFGATNLKDGTGGAADGDAGRVVAAVFEAAQTLDDDWNYLLWTDVANYAAHGTILFDWACEGRDGDSCRRSEVI
jgi:hypothetical protein